MANYKTLYDWSNRQDNVSGSAVLAVDHPATGTMTITVANFIAQTLRSGRVSTPAHMQAPGQRGQWSTVTAEGVEYLLFYIGDGNLEGHQWFALPGARSIPGFPSGPE